MEDKKFRRRTRRFPMACSVHYFTLNGAGEGTVVDVSLEGAEIRGDLTLQTGSLLSLLFYLPDGNAPAKINGASVQWAKDNRFAVKFPSIQESWKKRLMTCCGIPAGEEHLLFEDPSAVAEEGPKTVVPTGVTVLMVHENPNLLELSAGILREEGFTVVQATDSRAALHLFDTYASEIDLLLVEARIPSPPLRTRRYEPLEQPHPYPRLHGVELVRCLTSRMKIPRAVVMSADTEQKLANHGISIGALPFFPLPFSRDALMSTVRQVMREPVITPSRFERKPERSSFGRLKLQCT